MVFASEFKKLKSLMLNQIIGNGMFAGADA
jgi:hypothetical protein